jgi:Domain of Unknown Function with PDB structure (DUF3857)
MKKTLISLAILLIAVLSHAQTKEELKVKFGKISDKEIAMKSYDKDPDAPAVVLFDKGYFSRGNFNGFEKHIRIKIFKKEAYDKANFRIVFNRGTEESLADVKASCFNDENGKLVETKTTSDNIHDEQLTKDIYVRKITIPNVKEGSIIELKYTINNPDMKDWTFQDDIPTIWSEYELLIPDYYFFTKIGQGSTPYTVNETDKKTETVAGTNFIYGLYVHHWIQKDVPAIKSEKYISSLEDYRTKLSFHLQEVQFPGSLTKKIIGTWEETSKKLMDDTDFGDFIDKKSALKDELPNIIKEGMTPTEKVQAVYEYVGKNFEVQDYSFSPIYATATFRELKQKRKVTTSEMNLIFLNMLKTLGISATPVITRSRDNGRIGTTLAALRRYNRVIANVKIEKDTFFVDASGYPQPMKLLPLNALSGYGIEILAKEKYAVAIPQSKIATRRYTQANFALNTEGVLDGDINLTYSGYDAVQTRKMVKEEGEEKFVKNTLKDLLTDGKLGAYKFENTESLVEAPMKGNVKLTTSAYVNKTGDKIFINPLLSFSEKENPFKMENRKFDIDFGAPKGEYYQISLTLPEGYSVEEAPKSERMALPEGDIKFEYLIDIKDNKITINSKFNIKRTNFTAEDYPILRELYAKMTNKMNEQIVLTKKNK